MGENGPSSRNNKNRRKGKHSGPGQAAPQNKNAPVKPRRRKKTTLKTKKRPRPSRDALFYSDKSTRYLLYLSSQNHKYFCFTVSLFPAVTYSPLWLPPRFRSRLVFRPLRCRCHRHRSQRHRFSPPLPQKQINRISPPARHSRPIRAEPTDEVINPLAVGGEKPQMRVNEVSVN